LNEVTRVAAGCESPDDARDEIACSQPSSFRDPAGFVFRRGKVFYRQVNVAGRKNYDLLMGSGLYAALVEKDFLVGHEEVPVRSLDERNVYRVLQPQQIGLISYPYEWCFSQFQDAALLTLDTQLLALEHGMSLKDATAYNVQFMNGRPILIDTLSFESYDEGHPWVAYRQFCQHFLAPLALMARVDIRLNHLLRAHIDGIPLDLASKLLPARTRLNMGLLMHLHLHARMQGAYASTESARPKRAVRVSRNGLVGMIQGLRGAVSKLRWSPSGTEWGQYYQSTNYSDASFNHKKQLVAKYLALAKPRHVWDLGANTGVFSRLAADAGTPTVAFDIDPAAVEINYREARRKEERFLLPLLLDLTNPTPGLGWGGEERESLLQRGPVDCAMALALIHHIAISNNVPLSKAAIFLAQLCRTLIIEFVPKADSQVQRLLSSREDIFEGYHQAGFEAAFSESFQILRNEPISGTERTLYLMRSRMQQHNAS